VAQTTTGIASIASLISQLDATPTATGKLSDIVTFISLNVFGRTMSTTANDNSVGRGHNASHQVSLTIGNTLRPGVIGGIAQLTSGATIGEYGALAIDPTTGGVATSGGIAPVETLASYGQTIMAASGIDDTTIATAITSGQIVKGAIVS
jgi:hypothetical protein